MRRIAFCFDGTTNELGSKNPTNVVTTAQSIAPISKDDRVQLIHYVEGVGTKKGEKASGGMAGQGLYYNVVSAYKFLVFNYEVDDEIYVFGFSRGAYTARAFVGLIQSCGILPRVDADRISEVEKMFRSRGNKSHYTDSKFRRFRAKICPHLYFDTGEEKWRADNISEYTEGSAKRVWIEYLGLWDTVRSIGLWDNTLLSDTFGWGEGRYKFYDADLSPMVKSARHAMALDERRRKFNVLQWRNVDELNKSHNFNASDPDRPYQQVWFPGTHGGVGGGGGIKGLSDRALDWVLDGARCRGLRVDHDQNSPLFHLKPNHCDYVDNVDKSEPRGVSSIIMDRLPKKNRSPGPAGLHEVDLSAVARWKERAESLAEREEYRPALLHRLAADILSNASVAPERLGANVGDDGTPFIKYKVGLGDTLGRIAEKHYGNASRYREIADFNYPMILDPDKIYVDMVIRIPNPQSSHQS